MADNRGAQALRKKLAEREKQADLAEEVGISQPQLSRLARGEKPPAMRVDAIRLREKLGIEVEWWDQPASSEAEPAA